MLFKMEQKKQKSDKIKKKVFGSKWERAMRYSTHKTFAKNADSGNIVVGGGGA